VKGLVRELRLALAEWLMEKAFDLMPDGDEELRYCQALVSYTNPTLGKILLYVRQAGK